MNHPQAYQKRTNHNQRAFGDRRKFSYAAHSPERRSGMDRRKACQQDMNKKQTDEKVA